MRTIQKAGWALALSASLTLPSACASTDSSGGSTTAGTSTTAAAPSTAPSLSPADLFGATLKDLATKPYQYSTKVPASGDATGSVDPAAGNSSNTLKAIGPGGRTVTFLVLLVGSDHYVKVTGVSVPGVGSNWIHFDPAKLPLLGKTALVTVDPTGITTMQKSIVTANRAGDTVTGTFDATQVADTLLAVDSTDVANIGAAAKSLPFTETLDAAGQIKTLKIDLPAYGSTAALTTTTTFTAIGTPVTIAKPAKIVEATAAMYAVFNS